MENDKHQMGIMIDRDVRHKLLTLHMVKKHYFDDTVTISRIVNTALNEYFENHRDEIRQTMDEYHERGGCAEFEWQHRPGR